MLEDGVTKKRDSNRNSILVGMGAFPPSPTQPSYLPIGPSRKRIRVIGGLALIVLLVSTVLWQAGYLAQITPLSNFFVNFYAQIKQIKLPKIALPEKASPVTEEPMILEDLPPPIPKLDPNLLIGRYPVRKYTTISYSPLPTEGVIAIIKRHRNKIFPKKYRNYRTLARYNRIRPPKYTLVKGAKFLIPTAEHIMLPKVGYEDELDQLQSKLDSDSNNSELLNQLGVIRFKRNELYQAAATLQKSVKLVPDSGMFHNNLGYIYLILEDNKAQSELEQAITHSENSAVSLCNLGTLYMTEQKLDLAIKAFEDALAQEANLLDAKYNLALAYKEIGQIDSAKKQMEELSQLLPDDDRVRSVLEELGTKPDSVEKE